MESFVRELREQLERDASNAPLLERYERILREVGNGTYPLDRSWIELTRSRLYLDALYKRVARLVSNPIVLLNMCESARATPGLAESFVHFFGDRGARAVLGTECFMSTEFAHPFASDVLARLLDGESIGEALRVSRNQFVREERNPLGLAYTLYGSGAARARLPGATEEVQK